ncbi:MAG: MFS transporter [Actinomycetes bacterium]
MTSTTPVPLAAVRGRTTRVLVGSQVLGGVGIATGFAVGALLAEDISGSATLSGLAQTAGVLGGALAAVPLARLSIARGRRWGLGAGYAVASVGAVVVAVGAAASSLSVLLVGMALFGVGQASGLQARYAATDVAEPARRSRALATVVWATTVGAVLGPSLADPAGGTARALGLPSLAGPFLWSLVSFGLAALTIQMFLRPDPLLLAREWASRDEDDPPAADSGPRRDGTAQVIAAIRASPNAVLALVALVAAHAVMIGVMSMTPVHLGHGGVTLRVIGLVFSVHILGMYAFSPVVGWLADRVGRVPVLLVGCGVLVVSLHVAGHTAGHESQQVGVGLFLLGLGWSCCIVAGSTLLSESVGTEVRPAVQGAADLVMGLGGAAAGGLAGVVVGTAGYDVLAVVSSVLTVPVIVLAARALPRSRRPSGV